MSLVSQYPSSEQAYRRQMEEFARMQMIQQQYMAPSSLSAASLKPAEPSPVLLLLPRKGA